MKTNRLSFLSLVAIVVASCTSTREVLRSDIRIHGDSKQNQDGLTMEVKVTDMQTMQDDARLAKTLDAVQASSGNPVQVKWVLLNPPTFEVKVTNTTGHVIKLTGAIFKLIDQAGNLYDAYTKDKLAANTNDSISQFEATGYTVTPASKAALSASYRALKIMDENTQLLPDMTEKFFISFELPVAATSEAVNGWLAQQSSLRLKIYEVPTQTDAAGAVTHRVAFEFPVEVKTVKETWEDSLNGRKLVSSVDVQK